MISEKQLLANRKNARRSTGPRTAEGKAVSSQNAIRHGLRAENTVIPGEDPAEFDRFRQLLLEDLDPAGAMEVFLADRIVAGFWKLRRAGRIETDLLKELNKVCPENDTSRDAANLPFKITVTQTYSCPVHGGDVCQEEPPENCLACTRTHEHQSPEGNTPAPTVKQQTQDRCDSVQEVRTPMEDTVSKEAKTDLGRIFMHDMARSNSLARFRLYEGQIERSLYKALAELQKRQFLRSRLWMSEGGQLESQTANS